MRRLLALIAAGAMLVGIAQTTLAAPITCPPGQTIVKDQHGDWHCENKPDQGDPSTEQTKRPND